ncbi:MAG TPA: adenylate/guanylate cyclase domain-containing protein [Mycobacteriales bacterium]|nr:adenylate/guanylate cyclase domain-containing protein [Mycobacteriales bacterium]
MTRPQPDDSDHHRIVELLRSLGATDSEIDATPLEQRSALALDVVLRDGRPPVSLSDAAEAIGRPAEDLARLWRALGFASNSADALIPASLVDAQQILATTGTELLGREATLGLARVIGASTARLAEALVDSFRVSFELPELDRGARYSDVVKDYVDITRVALPSFESMVLAAFRAHLVRVAGSAWMPDLPGTAARRTLAIGFADLVGYTALSRTLTATELAQMLRRFEDGVNDVLAEHGGRLVKQIGDGVMFTAETADEGAAIALALAAAFSRTDDTPPVRVSLAWGVVLTHLGDYYGDVVNLAARLVALAKPGTVVISDDALEAMGHRWRTERLPDQALKGFGTPAAVHRLVG